ncbi:hypothetical protein OF83DRAFT_1079848 [Amylostereum chailletii]|nr:hypothetical protein OF83DRAFT_1079848 [Amylostereum chailletii]
MGMSIEDTLSQDEERIYIDDQLHKLEAQIHVLKLRRNVIAGPISSVPAEVMALIFFWVGRSIHPLPEDHGDKFAWLHALTGVCHGWREIVLGEPRLWRNIDVSKVSRTEVMIERAKMVPLHVEAKFLYPRFGFPRTRNRPGAPSSDAVSYALTRISQISHLNILASVRMLSDLLQKVAVEPNPTLEELALHSVYPYWSLHSAEGNPGLRGHVAALEGLLQSSFTNLQSLKLSNITVPWQSLHGLRRLEIRNGSSLHQPPLNHWCEALRRMPELEHLVLIRSGPEGWAFEHTASSSPHHERTVELPHLTHLTLTNTVRDVSRALSCLSLPSIQNLNVNCLDIADKADISRLIPSLARNSHGQHDASPIRAICISGGNRKRVRGIQITGYLDPYTDPVPLGTEDSEELLSEDAIPPRFRFTLLGASTFKVDSEIFINLSSSLPLEGVEILVAKNFQGRYAWGRTVWTRSFAHCSRIETLHVIRNSASLSFIDALSQNAIALSPRTDSGSGASNTTRILFPSLRYFTLDRAILPSSAMESLGDALMRRWDMGVQLDAILMLGGSIHKQHATMLSEMVPEVQLSHVQMEYEDDPSGAPRSPTIINHMLAVSSHLGGAQHFPVPLPVLPDEIEFDMPSLESISNSSQETLEYYDDDDDSVLSESDLEVDGMHGSELFGPSLQEVDALLDGAFDPSLFEVHVNQHPPTFLNW